jgi:parvulin-like peptidyl-prolyl isomerase
MRTMLAAAILAAALIRPAAGAEPPADAPLATRGDIAVTVEDFNAVMSKLPEDRRFSYRASLDRLTATVSNLYVTRVLAREARAAGISEEPEVKKRLQIMEEDLLAQIYLERFEKAIKTPDYEARAREIYVTSPERFKVPEKVMFRHILVDFQGRTRDEARRRAEEAHRRILAKENIVAIVRDFTNDPVYRENRAEIGPAPYSALIKEIADEARKLSPGDVSPVFESEHGFHVIVLLERSRPSVIPFEEAKKILIEDENTKYRRAIIDKKLGEITQSKEITLYTDNIAALKTEVDREELRKLHEEQARKQLEKRGK